MNLKRIPVLACLLGAFWLVPAFAADGDWQAIIGDLVKSEKAGSFGLCGVLVDHQTGCLYVDLSDKGLYCSTDQGKTWKRQGTQGVKGRTESPGCMLMDPFGKSIVIPAGPKFEVLATSDLGELSSASPAVAGGRIYLKGSKHLFCVGKK